MNGKPKCIPGHLKPGTAYRLSAYNVLMMMLSSGLLIYFLIRPVDLTSSPTQGRAAESASEITTSVPATANPASVVSQRSAVAPGASEGVRINASGKTLSDSDRGAILVPLLLTMMSAGAAGGTLCNLRGIFMGYRYKNGLEERLEVPFYIRPFMGAGTGLFVFFLAALFSGALVGTPADATTLGWMTLSGRLPFVALAILAGFGSLEFMQRTKEVARTTFADTPKPDAPMRIVEVAEWTDKDGPEILASAGADELVLVYGNLKSPVRASEGNGKPIEWHIYYPDEAIKKPWGRATAVKIAGRTSAERQAVAEQMIQGIAKEKGVQSVRVDDY